MLTRRLQSTLLLCVALLMSSAGFAQSGDVAQVEKAVEAFRQAVISKDRKQLEALTADALIYGHSDGRTETKTQYVDDATGPRAVWKSIDLRDQTVKVTGDTAIVRHLYEGVSEREGGKIQNTKIGVMMVWQKQAGQWRLLARQAYRV